MIIYYGILCYKEINDKPYIYGKVANPENFEEFRLNFNPSQAMEVA